MTKVTNNAAGPRGINLSDGTTRYLEPGETADVEYEGELYEGLSEGEAGLSSLKKADLIKIAQDEGVTFEEKDTRDVLIEKIEAARSAT